MRVTKESPPSMDIDPEWSTLPAFQKGKGGPRLQSKYLSHAEFELLRKLRVKPPVCDRESDEAVVTCKS
ncbi:hypothetical protein EVAR_28209_1 [Eumeta japonica]|uniref:Uncharacterized protein n=1 Tax=Eumeta variegata TaxID=151549 RepID=A0A4C1VIR5_EUMVA|nr:hypothetical protein EVAR_28209_1 [Eumeta japonica]